MKVLIAGGAGFIGLHLAKYLAEKRDDVTICDNLFRGEMDSELTDLIKSENVEFVNADLTDGKEFEKIEPDFDLVYHLAAINGTNFFYDIPHVVLRVNVLTLLNTLDWLTRKNCQKLIWTSSSEVYAGAIALNKVPVPTPEDIPLVIEDVFNPRFSYAASKIVGESLCLNYAKSCGLNVSIVRPHNIYGPRMGYEHVIPQFITRIIRREDPFRIYGGSQSRAFCFIEDLVRGLASIGESPKTNNEIVNIGNDKEEITIINLTGKMFDLFHFHPELEILPPPKGSVNRRCPDITKARELLGYEPQIDLNTGLQRTYDWYLKCQEG